MTTYTTAGGEMIDQITWRHYGNQLGTTEAVLAANPGLAGRPYDLPPGMVIELPALAVPADTVAPVKLYD